MEEAIKLWDGSSVMKFHINFDSGMGRIGIRERKELKEFLKSLEGAPFLELEGVYTHFATADEVETSYFDKQYNTFLEQLSWLKEFGVDPSLFIQLIVRRYVFKGLHLMQCELGLQCMDYLLL